jgi:hypothetical protein
MSNKALPKPEGISIISKQVYKRVRLIPKKVKLARGNFLLCLNNIDKRVTGNIDGLVEYAPTILRPLSMRWEKIGTYKEDVNNEPNDDLTTKYLDLYLDNKKIQIISHECVSSTENCGFVKERKNFFSRWKKKRLENLDIIRNPFFNYHN